MVLSAAIKYGNDEIFVGAYHKEAERKAKEVNDVFATASYEKGFIDSRGRFLNLRTAYHQALKNGQIAACPHCQIGAELSSETLKATSEMVEKAQKLAEKHNKELKESEFGV